MNKVATAVELRVDVGRSALPPDVRQRLIVLAGRHVTSNGVLVIDSRVHRSQAKNRDAARARLLALLQRAAKPPKKRKQMKPPAATREARLVAKKLRGALESARRGRGEG